jgi:hypothetical protein
MKILEFPKNKIIRDIPLNVEVIEKAKEKAISSFADQSVEAMVDNLLEQLDSIGIDTNGDEFFKDFSLTIDSLRSTVYRHFKMPHHLHELIDNGTISITDTQPDSANNGVEMQLDS